MFNLRSGASVGALAIAIATPAMAQEQPQERLGGIAEIVVTATKRSENLQDVAVSVNAIGEQALDELRVDTFEDYLEQLPNVTAGGGGPGQSTIYVRGLASTTPNLTTAGVAGLAPNVALYLDEQPLSQPGRNLDVYAADMERIEVLAGPQGTLFGASSQAGTVRLITNKPSLSGAAASAKGGIAFTKGGDESYKGELTINLPLTDSIAIRAVGYFDDQGGYIDNIGGTRSFLESGRFRSADTVRANGVPVGPTRAGFQAGADLSGVTFVEADNTALIEKDFNDTQYSGFRFSALYEISPDWSLTVTHSRQNVDSDGVFFADPDLGFDDLEIQRFEDDVLEDKFNNTSWTLEGRIGALELLYTGAYTDRRTEQRVDYTDYLFVGQYLPYYMCDTAVVYPGYVTSAPADPTCQAPNTFVSSQSDTEVFTQEFRVNTPQENRIRATVGGFYSDLELKEQNTFNYFSQLIRGSDGVTQGFLPNYPLTNTSVTGAVGNAAEGYFSDPGPFQGFRNDVKRTDKQWGLFGEASFDVVPDTLSVTLGARYYDIEVDFEGSANSIFFNLASPVFGPNTGVPLDERVDVQLGGTNISAQYAPNNAVGAPDKAATSGVIFKGTVTFTPTDDLLFYATYSEGFRPGLLNRPGGRTNPAGTFTVPFELETDEVKNFELGWKTDLLDRQLRFNGSAFYVDISRLQTTIFDPSIVNLFFSDNAADARIFGVEGDFTVAPYSLPGLTVAGAFSFLDTKITKVLTPTNDVLEGEDLAFAPPFQGNMRVRYEWDLSDTLTSHVQAQVLHSASKYTDIIEINKLKLGSYTTVALSAGVKSAAWGVELYADNLFDERAELSGSFVYDRARIITNRPRTIGLRVSYDY